MKERDRGVELEREGGRANGSILAPLRLDKPGKGEKGEKGGKGGKAKADRADRAADSYFRMTLSKHQSLSVMADNKAHLMLTVCAGIIGFTFKNLFDPIYVYATAVLIACCALSAGFAIYVTMPRLGALGKVADWTAPNFNIAMFSDFARVPYDVFEREMENVIRDQGTIHRTVIRDLYSLGKVLHEKKYRYLRYCYLTFLTGLVLSGAVLAATLALLPPVE
jgi:hypothetical protein